MVGRAARGRPQREATKKAGQHVRPFAIPAKNEIRSAPLDLGDLIGLGAARRHDLDGCALLLANQRARQRRGDGDAALLGVRLDLADDLPHRLLVGVFVDQRHGGAELDGVTGELGDVDDVGARQLVLKLGDAAIITTSERPFKGTKGYYRVNLKHAISRVRRGQRIGIELAFHDAR